MCVATLSVVNDKSWKRGEIDRKESGCANVLRRQVWWWAPYRSGAHLKTFSLFPLIFFSFLFCVCCCCRLCLVVESASTLSVLRAARAGTQPGSPYCWADRRPNLSTRVQRDACVGFNARPVTRPTPPSDDDERRRHVRAAVPTRGGQKEKRERKKNCSPNFYPLPSSSS